VYIDIVDENDNSPVFDRNHYVINIPIDIGVGNEFARLHANDRDSTNNGDVSYALKTATGMIFYGIYGLKCLGIFAIDYETGGLVTVIPMSIAANYSLTGKEQLLFSI
jgi:hypothetical protein